MTIRIPPGVDPAQEAEMRCLLRLLGTDDPTLEQMWLTIDAVWDLLGCSNTRYDSMLYDRFYRHGVWLLNGLFIEQHAPSLEFRSIFADWVVSQSPRRVADFGGGAGTLARMIGEKAPGIAVDVVEPHPQPFAVERLSILDNVRYCSDLTGEYDILIATDVFEHLLDPLGAVEATAAHLRIGGRYLMASCFYPVIKCHLPSTFHFRDSWKTLMMGMSLRPVATLAYATVFEKHGEVQAGRVRAAAESSRRLFPIRQRVLRTRYALYDMLRPLKRRLWG